MAEVRSAALSVPKVSLTTFAEYLTAGASARIDCIRNQIKIYEQDYRPGPAFYRDFVDAVVKGRSTGSDHLVMQHVVQTQRNDARHEHYAVLAEHWLNMSRLHLPLVSHGQAVWVTPRLTVGIRPDFAIKDAKGQVSIVKLWLKEHELAGDASRAMLWLLDRHMADLCPDATPLVVDVRREKIYPRSRRIAKRGFDAWLETEAGAMSDLWGRLAAA